LKTTKMKRAAGSRTVNWKRECGDTFLPEGA
jgi:hypothetical protein